MIEPNGQAEREHGKDADLEPGFKMTELGPLPKDWEVVRLGDMADNIYGGGTPSTKKNDYWDGSIPWTTTAIIKEDDIYLRGYQRCITEQGLANSSSKIAPKGSVLIGTRVGVGKAVVTTLDIAVNQDITAVTTKGGLLPEFLVLSLKAPIMRSWFEDRKRGSTIKGVPRADVLLLEFPLPPVAEQRGIVHALNAVQRGIEVTGKVVDAARELKKSLMRHLFTYGPVPFNQADQVPLKETEIGPVREHWNIVQLSDVIRGKPQNGAFVKNPQIGKGTPFVNVYDVYQNVIVDLRMVERIQVAPDTIEKYALRKNDLLFVRSSLKRTGVGQCCMVGDHDEPAIFDCHLIRVSPDTQKIDPLFLTYYFLSEHGKEDLIARSKTTTMTTINQSILLQSRIPTPSLSEQQEIARILQAVNKKIEAEENRKRALETQFKTLLHYLMMGKIRVKPEVASEQAG